MSELELDGERVIETPCAHFANDTLSTQELEVRCEHAYMAVTAAELRALAAGLPALPPEIAVLAPLYSVAPASAARTNETRHLVLMSNLKKRGMWTPAAHIKVTCIMGTRSSTFATRASRRACRANPLSRHGVADCSTGRGSR